MGKSKWLLELNSNWISTIDLTASRFNLSTCDSIRYLFEIQVKWRSEIQDVNDFCRHLTDAWVEVDQSVINDDIDQWRSRLHACIPARGHLSIHRDII